MLKGISGCKIEVNDTKLIKSTGCLTKFNRLTHQIRKQMEFDDNNIDPNIITPKVYNIYYEHKYVEMEYMHNAINFIDFMKEKNVNLSTIKSILTRYIKHCISNSIMINMFDEFLHKYTSVIEKCQRLVNITHLTDITNKFEKHLLLCKKTIMLPHSYCHGDLSLSNILIQNDKLIFIDFLDNFVSTIMQDIVKIQQDTKHHIIVHINNCNDQNVIQNLNKLDQIIHESFKNYEFYKYYNIYQALNLLRIIPYVNDQSIIDKLCTEICTLLT